MSSRPNSPTILPLTSVRFLAALGVVIHHCGAALVPSGIWPLMRLMERGYVGVTLFFVLSGFVLTLNYAHKERVDSRSFLIARFARVYPLYALTLLLALPFFLRNLLLAGGGAIDATMLAGAGGTVLLCVLLLQAWFPLQATLLNPSAWSLSAEAFFYAMFPAWMNRPSLRGFLARPALAIPLLWILGTSFSLAWILLFPDLRFQPGLSRDDLFKAFLVAFNPLVRFPEFLIGCSLGLLHLRGGFPVRGWTAVLLSLAVLLPAISLPAPGSVDILLHNSLLAPAFGLLVIGLATLPEGGEGILAAPWLVFLGEASYGLYILHVPVRDWFDWFTHRFPTGLSPVGQSLLLIALCVGLSALAFRWVEAPARRWVRGRLS